jgi:hypothetical protein
MPTKRKYKLARLMEQGKRSRAFELSNILSVTSMESEEVVTLIISVEVLRDQTF